MITEGQFYLESYSSFRLFSDDLVGLKVKDAQLAYRSLRAEEIPDFKIEITSDTLTTFDSEKFQPILDRKLYFRLIVSEPLTFTMPHVYENGGHFGIRFVAKSAFSPSEVRRDHTISIQSTISKMRLLVTPPNVAVDANVDINVQLSKGSNVRIVWDYGDGNQAFDQIAVIKNNQKFTKTYQFRAPGVYTIRITAGNLQGNTTAEHEIIVEHPVLKHWKVNSDSPKLLPSPVKFSLSYPEDKILPTNATAFISFGDGRRHLWKVPEAVEDWTGEMEVLHVYEKSGLFNVEVEISNVVSKLQKRFQVDVSRRITGLDVRSKHYLDNQKITALEAAGSEVLPLGAMVNYNLTLLEGDVEYYLVKMNDELYKNTTKQALNVTFNDPGVYHFFFYGYNHIQNLSRPAVKSVNILELAKGLEIVDISNDTIEPETKRFHIDIQTLGTNSCLLIDFGERIPDYGDYQTFGNLYNCKQLYPGVNAINTPILARSFEVSRSYAKPKNYIVRFTLANLLSKEVQELNVVVLGKFCQLCCEFFVSYIFVYRNRLQTTDY